VSWLGFDWADRLFYASDYFEEMYQCAERLIEAGLAYVDSLSADEVRQYRGTLTEPGRNSPDRSRPPAESLDLFRRMRAGEFADGSYLLRARIDMASPNINMRDPALYRIRRATHHRTGDAWCIYPTYDYAHPISDAIEGITHSLCTLEFEDHRPLYDWVVEHFRWQGRQPVAAAADRVRALNLNYTVMSKRKMLALVELRHRRRLGRPAMPTIAASAAAATRRGHARLLLAHRRRQERRTSSTSRCSRRRCARTSITPRRGLPGGVAAAQVVHREPARRARADR
jgi:glutaminyl-tRNA synthetase